jgi:hypothetical protein
MERTYNVTVLFGNGQPIKTVVIAKTAFAAQEQAMKRYPCARRALVKNANNSLVTNKQ